MSIDCHHCIYYHVTWDAAFPHGCRAMGFKSWQYPITEVRSIMQGKDCLLFTPKSIRNVDPTKVQKNIA